MFDPMHTGLFDFALDLAYQLTHGTSARLEDHALFLHPQQKRAASGIDRAHIAEIDNDGEVARRREDVLPGAVRFGDPRADQPAFERESNRFRCVVPRYSQHRVTVCADRKSEVRTAPRLNSAIAINARRRRWLRGGA